MGPTCQRQRARETALRGPTRRKAGCWAAAGPRAGDEANQAGKSEGFQRTLADGPRELGWALSKERSGAFSRLLNFERFKLKIKHLNSNANLNSSNQKQCTSMNATINSYD